MRPPPLALLALPLAIAGCTRITQTNGSETLTATALFTNLSAVSDCTEGVDQDTGMPTSSTHHTLTTQGDAATLHEANGLLGSLLAFASKFVPVPVPPVAARPPGRLGATPAPAGSPAVTSCAGERTTRTPAEQAPPAVQQQSNVAPDQPARQLAADEALQRRLEFASRALKERP